MTKKVLVLGGYGTCGRRIAEILAQDPAVECVIGGRDVRRGQAAASQVGVEFVVVEAQRAASLNAALDGVFAVVNTCGPFHWRDYTVAERCARRGVYYVDMADDRSYILGIRDLSQRAVEGGVALVSGAGSALTFSSVLAEAVAPAFDVIERIDIAMLSGNRNPQGPASIRSLLATQGQAVRICERGRWREAPGFSRARAIDLPVPFGRCRLYARDAPEVEILSARYGAAVTYRTGFELPLLNRGHAWLGSLNRWGLIRDMGRLAGVLQVAQKGLRSFGQAAFGLTVVMTGQSGGRSVARTASFVAREDGLSFRCIPAVGLVRKWIAGDAEPGAFPCAGLLTLQDLAYDLKRRDVVLQLS